MKFLDAKPQLRGGTAEYFQVKSNARKRQKIQICKKKEPMQTMGSHPKMVDKKLGGDTR